MDENSITAIKKKAVSDFATTLSQSGLTQVWAAGQLGISSKHLHGVVSGRLRASDKLLDRMIALCQRIKRFNEAG